MTDYEIEDIAGTVIPSRGLQLMSIGPMKRLVWQWTVNGNLRSYSEIIQNGADLNAAQLRGQLDSAIEDIKSKYPDEEFIKF
ncbi:hypothetical protein [Yokenella regensburgei]|uniref:hypothetical protein n=1 Tax=Yokenella regensburgei TaxID=158877 RepID=UPI000241F721|nr:hypothetical protein [Yokenella regensburgei]EHM46025.1 hypothetical protein HMPREF0880_04076 [Yokenella regensburgei ATCC 43003]